MAVDYEKLLEKMEPGKWYTGPEVDALWKIRGDARKSRIAFMMRKKLLMRRGKTANVQYRIFNPLAEETKNTAPKLKPIPPTTLDELITAATKVGTENAVMKKALLDAQTLISKALENTK